METDTIPEITELTHKPLAEVIFELRWALQSPQQGIQRDPGFKLLLGRFYDRVRTEYPIAQDLPAPQVPEELTAHTVRHRFRAGQEQWPVTQLGPGVLTVNETAGYTWATFKPRLSAAIDALFSAYPTDVAELKPARVQLKYINAIPYDPESDNLVSLLADSLHTGITVDERLFEDEAVSKPLDVNLTISYPLKHPRGVGRLMLATGTREGEPSVIWQILVRSADEEPLSEPESIKGWLDAAHNVVKHWFATLCRGELLKSFQ